LKRFAFIFVLALAVTSLRAEQTVEQWGVFEAVLNGPTNGNPFMDAQFSARFSQGTNSYEANGFYDGEGTYRVRFMPPQQGEWHYVTESSSPALNGQAGEFMVTAPSPDNPAR
jgi:Domain of unknown function (DUF5060)